MIALTKVIPLTQGKNAIVDVEDYEWLSRRKWHYAKVGYAASDGGRIYMHRLIGNPSEMAYIDHINGDKLDNRRVNLRVCTHAQNNMNQRKTKGKSKYKGVCWLGRLNKWRAYIVKDRKQYYLGLFKSEEDAATAYNMAALRHFREFAKLNLIGGSCAD